MENFRFPEPLTYFSLAVIAMGALLTAYLLHFGSTLPNLPFFGPLMIGYGLSILELQIYVRFKFGAKLLFAASAILIISGFSIMASGGLGNIPISTLSTIPVMAGLFLLFPPGLMKNYYRWKSYGYFNGPWL